MFGATMNSYTLFHTAEDAARVPYLYEPKQYRLFAKRADDSVITVQMFRQDMSVPRRFRQMADWLEEREVLSRRRLGAGDLLFIPSSARVHQVLLQAMDSDPYLLAERVPALA
jgi:aminoglycoside N3'-acetyltransferase